MLPRRANGVDEIYPSNVAYGASRRFEYAQSVIVHRISDSDNVVCNNDR